MVLGTQSDCQRPRTHERHLNRDFFDAYDDAAGHYGAPETQSHAAPQALDCHRSTGGWLSHITRRSTTIVCHLMCDTWCLTPRAWVLRFAFLGTARRSWSKRRMAVIGHQSNQHAGH